MELGLDRFQELGVPVGQFRRLLAAHRRTCAGRGSVQVVERPRAGQEEGGAIGDLGGIRALLQVPAREFQRRIQLAKVHGTQLGDVLGTHLETQPLEQGGDVCA